GIFRPDNLYDKFPIAAAFAPDWASSVQNSIAFALDPKSYENLVVPDAILAAYEEILRFATDPTQWTNSNFNTLILNQVLAVNPWSRFMTSLIYKNNTRGLSRVWYKDSALLARIKFDNLYKPGKPVLYHNAYNLTEDRLQLFSANDAKYPRISGHTLCACSALPYIEEPVVIDGTTYCEGATVDTVNFEDLMKNHPDLDEVWVSRILDIKQVRKPENLYDALNNLVMLFAATTSEDDVKLFKHHVAKRYPHVKVIDIPVAHNVSYDWTYSNLDRSMAEGYEAADAVIKAYREGRQLTHVEAERVSDEPAPPLRRAKVAAKV
ncbi:MAG TPA: patatin-like phospholipase family protein, partial [Magnetospirillum sp.]|nr:patatin-like phospholipase family protein [Magnetospirillum sp.]